MRYKYIEFVRFLPINGPTAPVQQMHDVEADEDAIGLTFAGGKRVPWGSVAIAIATAVDDQDDRPAAVQFAAAQALAQQQAIQQPPPRLKDKRR